MLKSASVVSARRGSTIMTAGRETETPAEKTKIRRIFRNLFRKMLFFLTSAAQEMSNAEAPEPSISGHSESMLTCPL